MIKMIKTRKLTLEKKNHTVFQRRYVMAFLIFLSYVATQLQRMNLSFALVDMVNVTKRPSIDNDTNECSDIRNETTTQYNKNAEFSWDAVLQGFILSSTFIGVVFTQLPGGILGERLGVKKVILISVVIGSICNLLSPIVARTNPYLLFAAHLIKGLAQGFERVAIALISARWFPVCEKGYLSAFVLSGYAIGGAVAGAISGPVCELEFDNGWPLVFYIFGIYGVFVSILLIFFYSERPLEDPNISEKELQYILENTSNRTSADSPPTPWIAILTSFPTYALMFAMFGQFWMMFYLMTVHPIFMDNILNVPVKENGLLIAGPQLAQAIAGFMACLFSFWINRNDASKINLARKGCNTFAVILFLVGLGGIYLSGCDVAWNEFFLFLTTAAPAFTFGGSAIVAVDMTPTYCGQLMGIVSLVATFSGFIIPILTGKLTKYEQTMAQWHKLFLITAIITFVNGAIFLIWGSTEIQPYDPAYKKRKIPQPVSEIAATNSVKKREPEMSEVSSTHL